MILYFFCKLFKIIRVKTYIVLPDKSFKQISNIKNTPNIIIFNDKYYNITKEVTEIVNDTLIHNWINLEEMV